jgi:hypothetical protein
MHRIARTPISDSLLGICGQQFRCQLIHCQTHVRRCALGTATIKHAESFANGFIIGELGGPGVWHLLHLDIEPLDVPMRPVNNVLFAQTKDTTNPTAMQIAPRISRFPAS